MICLCLEKTFFPLHSRTFFPNDILKLYYSLHYFRFSQGTPVWPKPWQLASLRYDFKRKMFIFLFSQLCLSNSFKHLSLYFNFFPLPQPTSFLICVFPDSGNVGQMLPPMYKTRRINIAMDCKDDSSALWTATPVLQLGLDLKQLCSYFIQTHQ